MADEGSMRQAIFNAVDIFRNRREHEELSSSAIQKVKIQRIIKSNKEKK